MHYECGLAEVVLLVMQLRPRADFLSTGWRRYGLISIDEVPGGDDD